MDFETFFKECSRSKDKDTLKELYRNLKSSTKENLVKQTKMHSITVGMVEEVEFVDAKIRKDGTESEPKTVFTLVGGLRLHFNSRVDQSFKKLKNRQAFFRISTSSFGNNTLYHRVEEVLDTKSLLDLLSLSHLSRTSV